VKPLVGVDIGSTEVRVVQISGVNRKGYASICRVARAPIHSEAIVGGRIKNPHPVSLALATAFKEAELRPRGFIVGLSTPEVAVAQLQLPSAVKASEREGVLRTGNLGGSTREISAAIPLSTSVLSTQLLESTLTADNVMLDTLIGAVAAKSELDSLLQVCKLARAVPRAVDLSGAALLRALVRCAPNATEVTTIIDVGATNTIVVTRQGPYLRSLRVIPAGGHEFTRAIVSATKDDVATAEVRKMSLRVDTVQSVRTLAPGGYIEDNTIAMQDTISKTDLEEAVDRACIALLDSIQDAIDQDASVYNGYPQGIVLTGGTSLMGGFKERLAQRVGIETKIGRPWAVIERNRKTEMYFKGGLEDPAVLQSLSVAIGLGLWTEPQ